MAFYFVTGKLGNGKTLVSVSRIKAKLLAGCPVATNIDLNLQSMFGKMAKDIRLIRVPDKPTVSDLNVIGCGNDSYDESKNGLLVLDECGTWFNARNWQDKSRADVNNWFLHARKLGWDVILIVQDISIVDNQAREALSEFTAFCKRLDKLRVPLIGGLFKAVTGYNLRLPKVHAARVVYGASPADPLSDRWVYRGTELFSAYDTKQIFLTDYPHGPHSVLPPYYQNRRTYTKRGVSFYMRLTKIYLRKFRAPLTASVGVVMGLAAAYVMTVYLNNQFYREYQQLIEAMQKLETYQQGEPEPAEPVTAEEAFALIDGMRIVGYANYSSHVVYDLAQREKNKSVTDKSEESERPRVVTTDDLSSVYAIEPNGPCHVRLIAAGAHKDVYCL